MSSSLQNLWEGTKDAVSNTWGQLPTGAKVATAGVGALLATKALLPKGFMMNRAIIRAIKGGEGNGGGDADTASILRMGSMWGGDSGSHLADPVQSAGALLFPVEASVRALNLGNSLAKASTLYPWGNLPMVGGPQDVRCPVVFCDAAGNLIPDPSLYVYRLPLPIQGGLFSKIGTVLKKVAQKVALPAAKLAASFIPGVGPVASKLIGLVDGRTKPAPTSGVTPSPIAQTAARFGAALQQVASQAKDTQASAISTQPGAASMVTALSKASTTPTEVPIPQPMVDASVTPLGLAAMSSYDAPPLQLSDSVGPVYAPMADMPSGEGEEVDPTSYSVAVPVVEGSRVALADPRSNIPTDMLIGWAPLVSLLGQAAKWLAQLAALAWPFIKKAVINKVVAKKIAANVVKYARVARVSAGTVLTFVGPKAVMGACAVLYLIKRGSQVQKDALADLVEKYLESADAKEWRKLYDEDIKPKLARFSKSEQERAAELISISVFSCGTQASLPTAPAEVKKDYAHLLNVIDQLQEKDPSTYSSLEKSIAASMSAIKGEMYDDADGMAAGVAGATFLGDAAPLFSEEEIAEGAIPVPAPGEHVPGDRWDNVKDALIKVGIPVAAAVAAVPLIKGIFGNEGEDALSADARAAMALGAGEGDAPTGGRSFVVNL